MKTKSKIILVATIFSFGMIVLNNLYGYDIELINLGIRTDYFSDASMLNNKVAVLSLHKDIPGIFDVGAVTIIGETAQLLPTEIKNGSEIQYILASFSQCQIHWDSTGSIWVSGNSMYNFRDEKWNVYFVDDVHRYYRTFKNFQVDKFNNLWITTSVDNKETGEQLSELYKFSDGKFKQLLKFPIGYSYISRNNGNIIAALPDGRVIVQRNFQSDEEDVINGKLEDIYIFNPDETYTRTKLITPSGEAFNTWNKSLTKIIPESNDMIWFTLNYRQYEDNGYPATCCSGLSLLQNNKWIPFNEQNGLFKSSKNSYKSIRQLIKYEENRYLVIGGRNSAYLMDNDLKLTQISWDDILIKPKLIISNDTIWTKEKIDDRLNVLAKDTITSSIFPTELFLNSKDEIIFNFFFGLLIVEKDKIRRILDKDVVGDGLVYPNPASNKIYIRNSEEYENFIIFDYLGKIVQNGNLSHSSIDVSNLQQGNYFVRLTNKSKFFIAPFIKFSN